jgi:hypothetical protein
LNAAAEGVDVAVVKAEPAVAAVEEVVEPVRGGGGDTEANRSFMF